jgi:dephospho-CoA kinase
MAHALLMIVGITGTLGAGKGTVVEYLVKEKGFTHYSVRAYLVEEIERRGLAVDRDSMVAVGNELRREHGPGYLAEQLYERAQSKGGNVIIESLRTPAEIEALRAKGGFVLLAVDADVKTRYDRIVGRGTSTDTVSFETFVSNERREMESSDPAKQNLSACIAMADIVLMNDGDREELFQRVEEALEDVKDGRSEEE